MSRAEQSRAEQSRAEQSRLWLFIIVITFANIFITNKVFASGKNKIANDYDNFYSQDRLTRIGIGFLSAGVLANSNIDENIQNWHQDEAKNEKTDNYSKIFKTFGEWTYLIPVSILAGSTHYVIPDSKISKWGVNSARSYIVGVPALLAMQAATGASRPNESKNSHWKPFNDNNGVSGHAFIGAVPFLTIAKMSTNKPIKYMSYIASGLTAWSRINDDAHFTSQALLGWYMAYESVGSVFDTNNSDKFSVMPIFGKDTYGLSINKSW